MKHYKSLLLMLSMTVFTLVLIGGCGSDDRDAGSDAEHDGQEMHNGHDDDGHGHDADGHDHDDAHMDAGTDAGADTKASSASKKYQCPMKCEGEKTYKSNVGCPVCGMDLEELKS